MDEGLSLGAWATQEWWCHSRKCLSARWLWHLEKINRLNLVWRVTNRCWGSKRATLVSCLEDRHPWHYLYLGTLIGLQCPQGSLSSNLYSTSYSLSAQPTSLQRHQCWYQVECLQGPLEKEWAFQATWHRLIPKMRNLRGFWTLGQSIWNLLGWRKKM